MIIPAAHDESGLGAGIYSVADAAKLIGERPEWVRRLTGGYGFTRPTGTRGWSEPLVPTAYPSDGGELSFLDLVELKFISEFRKAGLSLQVIREAARNAAELFGTDHPFVVHRFQTDGRRIFATAAKASGEPEMVDLIERQHVFHHVVSRYMKQLEYVDDSLRRWFPLGRTRPVVLDPEVSFGAPVETAASVPTRSLAAAFKAGESIADVARWFDVPIRNVRTAVAFEHQLADA